MARLKSVISSSAAVICGLLFLGVGSSLYPTNIRFEEPDCSYFMYSNIIDILASSRRTTDTKIIRLINFDPREFQFPVKLFNEPEKSFVIGSSSEPFPVYSTFVEIKCDRDQVETMSDDTLPLLSLSRTVFAVLKNVETLRSDGVEACMSRVFEIFWEQRMTNVAVVFSKSNETSPDEKTCSTSCRVSVYVYEPYRKSKLKKITDPKYSEVFYDKTANLHLNRLGVLAYESERFYFEIENGISKRNGIDGSLSNLLGEIYNATIVFTYGSKEDFQNRNVESIIRAIDTESFDLWLNIGVISSRLIERITYSYPRERMDVACIIPNYSNKHMKYTFAGNDRVILILLSTIVAFCFVSSFIHFADKFLNENMSLFKLAKLVVNQSDAATHKAPSITTRVVFITWMISSLTLSTWLQTSITSASVRPSRNVPMKTIREVLQSDMRLRIGKAFWKMTKGDFDVRIYDAIRSHLDVVEDDDLFGVSGPDIGYLASKDVVEFVGRAKYNVYVLPESFFPNFASYYFSKKSPFNRRLDTALSVLTENGILGKWVSDNQDRVIKDLNPVGQTSRTPDVIPEHLAFLMYIYTFGMSIAFFVFICELYSNDLLDRVKVKLRRV